MDLVKESILKAAGVTVLILIFGILVGLQVDDARQGYVENQLRESNLNTQSLIVTREYLDDSSQNYCGVVKKQIPELSEQNSQIGQDLQSFAGKSISNDVSYKQLKREYYVSQLRLYNILQDYRSKCGSNSTLIFFFFDDSAQSQKQGTALSKYYREVDNKTHIFSYNLETDNSEVLRLLRTDFNVSNGPVTVINGRKELRGYKTFGELKQEIPKP